MTNMNNSAKVSSQPDQIKSKPTVSVTVVTYNHGVWLAECLDSVLSQKTDFNFEIIVGDDASTDGVTKNILFEYSIKYPGIISAIFRDENIGPTNNYFEVVSKARGEYIAHLDGDDQMLPGKLQRAVDLLNANPSYSMVVHDMKLIPNSGMASKSKGGVIVKKLPDLLLDGCFFCHSSKMYRASAIITKHSEVPLVDYFLHIEHAASGDICVVREVLGVHRMHDLGISKSSAFASGLNRAYEAAFSRATELGVDRSVVMKGRLRYRMAKGLSCLNKKDFAGFLQYAAFEDDLNAYASTNFLLIKYFRHFYIALFIAFKFRQWVKS